MDSGFTVGGRLGDGRGTIGLRLGDNWETLGGQLTVGSWQLTDGSCELAGIKKLCEVCSSCFSVRSSRLKPQGLRRSQVSSSRFSVRCKRAWKVIGIQLGLRIINLREGLCPLVLPWEGTRRTGESFEVNTYFLNQANKRGEKH